MTNELILLGHTALISGSCLFALHLGKEALITLISMLCVLSNLFVIKQITILGLHTTAAEAYAVGALLSLHILQEYYGKDIARKAVSISFFVLLFYALASQIHLLYTPSTYDACHGHFCALLRPAPRLALASLVTFLIVQNLDRYLYGRLLTRFGNRYIVWRNYLLLIFSQLLDTTLFSILALLGTAHNIGHIILVSFVIKLFTILIATPLVTLISSRIQPKTT
jgi:queuosine precursor transporter